MTASLSVQWSMIPAQFDANRVRPPDKPVGYLNPEIVCVTPSPTSLFKRLDRPLVHRLK